MASIRRSSPLTSTSFSVPSALALPASIRKNSSFARLASLVGLGKWTGAIPADADNEDEDEDDGEEGELSSGSEETPIDEHGGKLGESSGGRSEEALVWDAKVRRFISAPFKFPRGERVFVSRTAHGSADDFSFPPVPILLQRSRVTSARRGSAFHRSRLAISDA